MPALNNTRHARISDKRDFDANRPLLLRDTEDEDDGDDGDDDDDRTNRDGQGAGFFRQYGRSSNGYADDGDDGASVFDGVVYEIRERDRKLMKQQVVRILSFIWGVGSALCAGSITAFSLYGPLLQTRLHYSQFRVNAVAVSAAVSMYLPVAFFGYLCDRYTPGPISLISAFLFGPGYLLAAFTYKSGPPVDAGGTGWPFAVMIIAFIGVGAGTCCMYLAAVTTCAKNFGRGKHKGIVLALPIAAFGLSGMWQSQVGTHLLYERGPGGQKGDVDVFKYFLFLGILLIVVGIGGTFALRIVDEEEMIDEAVEELERSGILDESDFFRSREEVRAAMSSSSVSYGTMDGSAAEAGAGGPPEDDSQSLALSQEEWQDQQKEERRKKNWLLNQETRLFLKDKTMWWLAVGFFLITGPGEAYINNVGTIIPTLTPPSHPPNLPPPAGSPASHVTSIALTSTIARLLTGYLSDLFAPSPVPHSHLQSFSPSITTQPQPPPSLIRRITLSRLTFLLPSALLLSLGFLFLATPLPLSFPQSFHVTTALIGLGYGASFALVPIIISVVWGVENFGTNWGVVAMFPAAGAAVWGAVYSAGYEAARRVGGGDGDGNQQCVGWGCYGFWALGCAASVWVAIGLWAVAWKGWRQRGVVV
ncbi:crossover junction endonuclease EME1 [[Emmonsia] crescens]|uniref:Probable transporter MCH1 n=1 Tax=[Emmonsia] crescens TaxID=73230 RepID=A0A2B7ZGE6_9EURO|nr:crossover junction endonuclease EME1 [Emmonsia crescens]